jgi:hypothetical protein
MSELLSQGLTWARIGHSEYRAVLGFVNRPVPPDSHLDELHIRAQENMKVAKSS